MVNVAAHVVFFQIVLRVAAAVTIVKKAENGGQLILGTILADSLNFPGLEEKCSENLPSFPDEKTFIDGETSTGIYSFIDSQATFKVRDNQGKQEIIGKKEDLTCLAQEDSMVSDSVLLLLAPLESHSKEPETTILSPTYEPYTQKSLDFEVLPENKASESLLPPSSPPEPKLRPSRTAAELIRPEISGSLNTAKHKQIHFNLSNISGYDSGDTSGANHLDDCRFMSFEEWKKLKERGLQIEPKHTDESANINHTSTVKATNSTVNAATKNGKNPENPAQTSLEKHGRVYKDKFNYASVDCAATIVNTNSDVKGASAILTEIKDSYLINKCSTVNKFVVIELCQDILVSSVVMANFELFSSMFRTVKFFVSDRFPVTKGWQELGLFEAKNIRDLQTFNILSPLIWARYVKIELVSHYGNEFYCPISLVRVHGKTMMEEFKDADSSGQQNSLVPASNLPQVPVPIDSLFTANNSIGFPASRDLECKVVTPYLALNEFLKDFNSSTDYCDVSLTGSISGSKGSQSGSTTTENSIKQPTQELIFQNIVKRLSLLETNATLSLLYVEEQSKLLSDAFFNLEARQVRKFESLLHMLNETMHSQVSYLEKAVAKIRTDSHKLFHAQSLQSHASISIMRQETAAFARDISFLRKVIVADTLIIFLLLAYVIVTRETVTVTVEKRTMKPKPEIAPTPTLPLPLPLTIRPFPVGHHRTNTRKRKPGRSRK